MRFTKEEPLVIFLRIRGEAKARLQGVMAKHSFTAPDVAYHGLLAEVRRLELDAPNVDAETARAIAEARHLGLDPEQVLRRAIEDTTEKRAIDRILPE